MATIEHMRYVSDVSFQNLLRTIVEYLTAYQPKAGYMWEEVWSVDDNNEFTTSDIVYIIKKQTTNTADEGPMYVKLVLKGGILHIAASNTYSTSDNNTDITLTGSFLSLGESDNSAVNIFDETSMLRTPDTIPAPCVVLDNDFDYTSQRITKAWIIRQLSPLLTEVGERRNTNQFCWCSFCTNEEGDDPIERRGYYQHFSFGLAGEILVPDIAYASCPGLYVTVGSYANIANKDKEIDSRVWCGGAHDNITETPNGATYVLAGLVDGKSTWFMPKSMYGYARQPFDSDLLYGTNEVNVGIDFTELVKYSPYSGVRVLTPAYVFGCYENLDRILCRLPFFYTDLSGLYAGDTVSQVVNSEERNYGIFPFHKYRCASETDAKRGYGVFVPTSEEV